MYSRLVGVTAGLGVPSTLTWNGSSRTAPEMPAGVASAAISEGRDQGDGLSPARPQHDLTLSSGGSACQATEELLRRATKRSTGLESG